MYKLKKKENENQCTAFPVTKEKELWDTTACAPQNEKDGSGTIAHVCYCVAKGMQGCLQSESAHLKFYLFVYLAIQQIFCCKELFCVVGELVSKVFQYLLFSSWDYI